VLESPAGAMLQFRQQGEPIAVSVGRGFYLYLAQTLKIVKEGGRHRLRTMAYSYRITDGPTRQDKWLIRWEYNSREHLVALHPRHHCHIPADVSFRNQTLSLHKLHLASGWVTVEEVIRFLINELGVKPKNKNWDNLLHDSEKAFRRWTARSV
jgi:hypothetical protein